MRQFYETYKESEIVSSPMTQFEFMDIRNSLIAEIGWTQHLILMSRCKTNEERLFYMHLSKSENYSVKELDRQISASIFERTLLSNKTELNLNIKESTKVAFKDLYIFEFLNLTEPFTENELQAALLKRLKAFLLELGKDFLFMGEEYRIQVGNKDFYIDLLFYHR